MRRLLDWMSVFWQLDQHVLEDEDNRQDVHKRGDLLGLAGCNVQYGVGDDTEADTFGDGVHERHREDADECRDCLKDVIPLDLADLLHHEETDHDQCGCSGEGRNRQEQRREEQGQQEQEACRDCSQTCASAFCDTGSGFYEGCDRGSTEYSAAHCADSVGEEGAFDAGELALFVEELSFGSAADQGSQCIEHVDEQECEHNDYEVHAQNVGEVQLEECGCNGSGHGNDSGRNDAVEACLGIGNIDAGDLADNAENPGCDDAQKDAALDIAEHQDRGDQDADDCEKDGDSFIVEGAVFKGSAEREYGYQGSTVHNDVGVLQSDECDEKTDTNGNCDLEGRGNRVEDGLTNIGQRENNEDQTFHEDGGQCHLPGITHSEYDGVCEVRVQSHTCGEYEGQIRKERHQEGGNGRCQSGRGENRAGVHSGCTQNAGVNGQNIGHCHEGSKAGCQLLLDIRAVLLQFEKLFHRAFPFLSGISSHIKVILLAYDTKESFIFP